MEAIVSTNEINNYSVSELEYLRESIENMNKYNQTAVLQILHKNKEVTLNSNKNGIYVNLSDLKKNVLDELSSFVKYIHTQESNLNLFEQQKEDYKNMYFNKEGKECKHIKDNL
jgi:hypothetical protein